MAKRNGGIIGPDNVPAGPLGAAGGVWRLEDAFNAQKAGTWPVVLGYQIPNSLRFNSGSSDNLTRTFGTGNRKTYTQSYWIKLMGASNATGISVRISDDTAYNVYITSSYNIDWYVSGAFTGRLTTNRVFRDPNAWYHIVAVVDTTQATASDRLKLYINGVQETSFSLATYPSLNEDTPMNNSANSYFIGSSRSADGFLNGYYSEFYFIDGQALTPSSFGQTDSTTGIWTPIAYTGTYGTNGFYLNFANSADLGNDVSGNNNDFTVNNLTSIDQSYDSPTNNFATLNSLNIPTTNAPTFTEGNLQTAITSTGYYGGNSSIMASAGKWYAEFKMTAASLTGIFMMGVDNAMSVTARTNSFAGQSTSPTGYSIYGVDGYLYNNSTNTPYGTSYTTNDIISIALDLDNNKLYLAKNGTWMNSGVPTSGATGTGAISITASSSTIDGGYTFSIGDGGSTHTATVQANFGYPPFTIASGNADANGFGNFEYAVPSGYYALCSKNLALYG